MDEILRILKSIDARFAGIEERLKLKAAQSAKGSAMGLSRSETCARVDALRRAGISPISLAS